MLSKNNHQEQFRKQEPKKQRFTIKKLTVGVASVLIGFTFMGVNSSVNADTTGNDNANTPAVTGTTGSTDSNSGTTTGSSDQQQPVTGQSSQQTPASNSGATGSENSGSTDSNTNTLNVSGSNGSALSPAQLGASDAETQSQTVSDWQGLVNALNDRNIGTINLGSDVNITGAVNGAKIPFSMFNSNPGKIQLTGTNISRTLTINGNGHAINFGDYYLSFTTNNQKDGTPWDITFKDLSINANGYPASYATFGGAFSPIYMGGDDIKTSLLAKNKVTFDGVTADVKQGAFYQTSMTQQVSNDPYTTVTFMGNNNITCEAVNVNGNNLYNYSSAVNAEHIIFASGTTTFNVGTKKTNNDLNPGGNILRTKSEDSKDTSPSIVVENGATVNLNATSNDVRGIATNAFLTGTVQVDGNLNANMQKGHSTAIMTGNLEIGKTGNVTINTKQDNQADGSEYAWSNGVANYNGVHYAPISLGVGVATNLTGNDSHLTDNGSLTIIRDNTGKTLTPLISFGSGGVNGVKYNLTVGEGATLDLQDNSTTYNGNAALEDTRQPNTPPAGLITMFGSSSNDTVTFNNPGYVNFQRNQSGTSSLRGNFIRLEGTTNAAYVNGPDTTSNVTPVAQWDQGNFDSPSYVWYINQLHTQNQWGNYANSYTTKGQAPAAKKGVDTLLNATDNSFIMGTNQAGKGSTSATNGEVNATGDTGVSYKTNYLNQFGNNFNWWLPQRLAMGSKLNDMNIIKDAQKYQPEVQTIDGFTTQTLADLNVKAGIKDLIGPDGQTITDLSSIDWTKSHWYNSSTDATEWAKQTSEAEPTNPTGNLKTTDTSAVATIVYTDGSVDFATIPLKISDHIADGYDPEGGSVTVDKGTTLTPTEAKKAITNNGDLPTDATYSWKQAPSTDQPGDFGGVVTVTYSDNSTDDVPVTVHVKSQAESNNPVGQPITTDKGVVPDAKQGIKNTGDLPDGTTYTWENTPDVSQPGTTVPGVIKVTYPDGSTDDVPTTITVNKDTSTTTPTTSDNDQYDPQGQNVNTTVGVVPDAGDAISNKTDLPTGTTYTWASTPDVYTKGTNPAVVTVIYPDGTKDNVPTTVTVTNGPVGQNLTVPQGTAPSAEDAIKNKSDLPTGTTYEWVTTPDTTNPGVTAGTVKVTYPDGHGSVTVPVVITVTPTGSTTDFNPQGTTIDVPFGHDLDDTDAQNAINPSTIPSGLTDATYTWKAKPSTTTAGLKQGYVTVAGKLNGQDVTKDVPVYVNVEPESGNYNPAGQTITTYKGANTPDPKSAITNTSDLPDGTKYSWAVEPNTNQTGTQSDLVKVTYGDGSFDYVPVNVTIKDSTPSYQDLTVERPESGTKDSSVSPTLPTGTPAGTVTGYELGNFTQPTGTTVTVDNAGKVTVTVTKDAKLGSFLVPVVVTYQNGTQETINVPASVTGFDHKTNNYYNDQGMVHYAPTTVAVHKTSGDFTPAAAKSLYPEITISKWDSKTGNYNVTKTYQLNAEGTKYVNTADASDSFDAFTTSWQTNYMPNTNVANFNNNTGDLIYENADGTLNQDGVNAEQTGQDDALPGNSKYRYNYTINLAASNKLGVPYGTYWANAYFNFYGATGKQNIPVNVGDTVPTNAAGLESYLASNSVGTPSAVAARSVTAKDWTVNKISWEKNGQPGANGKFDASHMTGVIRFDFTDANGAKSYLDVPVSFKTGSYVPTSNSTVNDDTNHYVTRTIEYDVTGTGHAAIPSETQQVHYVRDGYHKVDSQGNDTSAVVWSDWKLADGQTESWAKKDVTQITGFNSYVDGKKGTTVSAVSVTSATKDKTVKVTYQAVPVSDTTVTYTFYDTIAKKTVGAPVVVSGKPGTTVNTGLIIPAGYKLAEGQTLPKTVVMPAAKNTKVTINLVHATKDITPTTPGVNPNDPKYADMFTTVTRKIYQTKPGQAQTTTTQSVEFGRNGVEDLVTGKVTGTGAWQVGKTVGNTFVAGGDAEFASENVKVDGYDTYINGSLSEDNTVPAVSALKNGQPANGADVTVTYQKAVPAAEHFAQNIVYQDKDGNTISTAEGAIKGTFTAETPATVSAATQKSAIDSHVPAKWAVAKDYTYPAGETISTKTPSAIVVTVEHATKDVKPTDPGVNPSDSKYADLFKTVTRKIHTTKPGQAETVTTQTVQLAQNGVEDLVTGKVTGTGSWQAGKISGNKFIPEGNAEFASQKVDQIDGYTSLVDGQSSKTVKSAPALQKGQPVNGSDVYVTYQAVPAGDTTVTYVFHDDTDNKTVDSKVVTGEPGTSVATGLTIPAGYKLADGQTLPATVEMPTSDSTITIHLVHATKDITPTTPGVNPNDPKYADMFTTVTRKIYTTKPGQAQTVTTQSVEFGRNGVEDLATGKVTGTGAWQVGKTAGNTFVPGGKAEFAEQNVDQVTNYDSLVNGKKATTVAAAPALKNGQPTNGDPVYITYADGQKTINPTDPGVDPTNDAYKDMFSNPTRTIHITNPDGTTTNVKQTVSFQRSKTIDAVTNQVISYGAWKLADGSAANWAEYDVPQIAKYDSVVDGTKAAKVAAQNGITADTDDVTVNVTYTDGQKTINPTDPGVDPTNDAYKDMFSNPTRTIHVTNPDGSTNDVYQTVKFQRSKTVDEVTNKVISYGAWELVGSADSWAEYNVPQINGYKSQVEGQPATTIAAQNGITAETPNATVNVSYAKQGPDADKYTPKGQDITTDQGVEPNPGDGIANKNDLPKDTNYTWTKRPDVSKPGQTTGTIKVTYPDGSWDEVTVTVTITEPSTNPSTGNTGNGGSTTANNGNPVSGNGGSTTATSNTGNVNNGTAAAKKTLPQTGNTTNAAAIAGLALSALMSMIGVGFKKREDK